MKKRSVEFTVAAITIAIFGLAGSSMFVARCALRCRKIDVAGGDTCWNVPPAARNIYAWGSYLGFAAEFDIREDDIVAYSRTRGWNLREIETPVNVRRYLGYDDEAEASDELVVSGGLYFSNMTHRGGFVVAYDRESGKGYLEYAHH